VESATSLTTIALLTTATGSGGELSAVRASLTSLLTSLLDLYLGLAEHVLLLNVCNVGNS